MFPFFIPSTSKVQNDFRLSLSSYELNIEGGDQGNQTQGDQDNETKGAEDSNDDKDGEKRSEGSSLDIGSSDEQVVDPFAL